MKELSIEQKAKAYDEAVINGSRLWECGEITRESYEYIFPELKESEDEESKKWILEYLHDGLRKSDEQFKDHFKTAIAWLEKQGKNNMGISEATKQKLEDNLNKALEKETPESWNEFLEKQDEYKPNPCDECININGCINCENGELKETEQKPAWSEEDEDILNTIINHFKVDVECTDEDDMVRWLKFIKDRYTWKPSDEQLNTLLDAIVYVEGCDSNFKGSGSVLENLYNDLQKLKDEK